MRLTLMPRIMSAQGGVAEADSLLTSLVAWWSLDEASGTRADSHSSGFDLTDVNTVGSATGVVSNASSHVRANSERLDSTSTDDFGFADDFTLSCWVKFATSGAGQFQGILKRGTSGSGPANMFRIYEENGTITYVAGDGTTSLTGTYAIPGFTTGTWYHLLFEHDNDGASNAQWSLRVNNGSPAFAANSMGDPQNLTSTPFRIGSLETNNYLDGDVDETAIWTRLLTSDERDRLYNSGSGMAYPG